MKNFAENVVQLKKMNWKDYGRSIKNAQGIRKLVRSNQNIDDILEFLFQCINANEERNIQLEAEVAICYLVATRQNLVQKVIEKEVFPNLIQLLRQCNNKILRVALHAFKTIVCESATYSEMFIDHGGLKYVSDLLLHTDATISSESMWILVMLTEQHQHIDPIIKADILPRIVQNLKSDKRQNQAVLILRNLTICALDNQINVLIEEGMLTVLCDLLRCENDYVVYTALICIRNILTTSRVSSSPHMESIDWNKIRRLQDIENSDIFILAKEIMDFKL